MKRAIDDGYRLLAAGYFRKQARQLAEQLDGVRRSEDVECVHRARVASRRLRAAMRLFGDWVGRKQAKRWRKEIRRVTKELGDARDKDVQIEFLCGALSRTREVAHCLGIAHLLIHLDYQREAVQPKVAEAVDRLQQCRVLTEMRDAAEQVLLECGNPEGGARTPAVLEHVGRCVRKRLKALLAYEPCLDDPQDRARHHEMRIAAKRLRYTLEISRPVFQGAVDETIEAVKKLQTLLGDLHDCDVWDGHLAAFLDEQRRRMAASLGSTGALERVRAGLDYLRRDRAEARKRLFQEAVDHWRGLRARQVWDRLRETVLAPARLDQEESAASASASGPAEQADKPAVPSAPAAEGGPGGNGRDPRRERTETGIQP